MSGKFRFSRRSEKNLEGVKPQLVAVVRRALELTEVDFGITEGLRSKYRQKQLVAEGKSQTMNSRHPAPDESVINAVRDHILPLAPVAGSGLYVFGATEKVIPMT
ncbi:hypothetical protein ACFMRQ_005082, partial [Escherichia coli]